MTSVITQNQSVRFIIDAIEKNDSVSAQLLAFFGQYCDCDIVGWLKGQLDAQTTAILNQITLFIAAPAAITAPAGNPLLPAGALIATYCTGTSLYATYADGAGGQSDVLRATASPSCGG